jgi:hypothetical protein
MVMATIVLSANIANAQDALKGLVSYWTFDTGDIKDKTVLDIIGGNHGTIMGNVKTVKGQIREALDFAGNVGVDYVRVENHENLIFSGKKSFTLEAWYFLRKKEAGRGYTIIGKGDGGAPDSSEYLWHAGSQWGFWIRGAWHGPASFQEELSKTNEWMHAAIGFNGNSGTISYYKNGKLVVTDKAEGNYASTTNIGLAIGAQGLNCKCHTMDGIIDEVRIYNRELTEAEVKWNFENSENILAVSPRGKLAAIWSQIKRNR